MSTNKKAALAGAAQNTTAAADCTEVITVIKARDSLAPRCRADGSVFSMDKCGAAVIEVREVPVRNLADLNALLEQLRSDTNSAIVQGRYVGDDKVKRKEDGSFLSFDTFVDQPSHLVTFRAHAARVEGPGDLEEKIGLFRNCMPEIFHGKPFVWRLRVKGKTASPKNMYKVYLTFWMDEPLTLAQVRALYKKRVLRVL